MADPNTQAAPTAGAVAPARKITRRTAEHRAALHQQAATWAAQTYRIALAALSASAPQLRRARRDTAQAQALLASVQELHDLERALQSQLADVQAAQDRVLVIVWGV